MLQGWAVIEKDLGKLTPTTKWARQRKWALHSTSHIPKCRSIWYYISVPFKLYYTTHEKCYEMFSDGRGDQENYDILQKKTKESQRLPCQLINEKCPGFVLINRVIIIICSFWCQKSL